MVSQKDLIPEWQKFEVNPLNQDLHVIRIRISTAIKSLAEYDYLLDEKAREKLKRIVHLRDKNTFVVSTIMKKIVCSRYLNLRPNEVSFDTNTNDKPFILDHPNIHFNLSHSGDWLIFAFSSHPCGIDIEFINSEFEYKSVMEMSYHEDEKTLVSLSYNPLKAFFKIWTLKEALLKAEGTGMTDDLKKLNTAIEMPKLADGSNFWRSHSFILDGEYWCSFYFQDPVSNIKFYDFP